jgi:hypothetical protein
MGDIASGLEGIIDVAGCIEAKMGLSVRFP